MSDLRGMWNRMRMAIDAAFCDEPPLQAGEWCDNCPARHACPALRKDARRAASRFETAIPLDLPDDVLGWEIRDLRRMRARLDALITGLEADAMARIDRGQRIAWFQSERSWGREQWTTDPQTVIETAAMWGVEGIEKRAVCTPNQARQKGLAPEIVAAMSTRYRTDPKLVEVAETDLRRVFQQ